MRTIRDDPGGGSPGPSVATAGEPVCPDIILPPLPHADDPYRQRKKREEQERKQREAARRAADPLYDLPELKTAALVGTAIEAEAKRPITFIWQDIATPGNIVVLAGPPADGKSTAMMLLLIARRNYGAEPIIMFGREMKPAPHDKMIVLIEDEQGAGLTSRQLVNSCEMLGLPLGPGGTLARGGVLVLARRDVTPESELWQQVRKLTEQGMVDSIFIDSLARFQAGGDSHREEAQAAVFAELQSAVESAPATDKPSVWMIAHTRKTDAGTLADLAGSVQRAAQVDVAILFKADRDDSMRVISSTASFVKIREPGDSWPERSTFSIAKNDGRWRLTWDGSAKVEDQPAHERVGAMLLAEGPSTKEQIKTKLSMSGKRLEQAIDTLFAERRVMKTTTKIRGVEREVFELKRNAKPSFDDVFAEAQAAQAAQEDPSVPF